MARAAKGKGKVSVDLTESSFCNSQDYTPEKRLYL